MDEAWELEREFWKQSASGGITGFYSEHLVSDGFVVLPSGVVSRNDLIARWDQHSPLTRCDLSEPSIAVIEGGNVVITYHVSVDADWIPDYEAYMTALYSWVGGRWRLVFRAHTPSGAFPF